MGVAPVSDWKKNRNEIEKWHAPQVVAGSSNTRKELRKRKTYKKKVNVSR